MTVDYFEDLSRMPSWMPFVQAVRGAPAPQQAPLRLLSAAGLRIDLSQQRYSSFVGQAGLALLGARGWSAWQQALFDGQPLLYPSQTPNSPHIRWRQAEQPMPGLPIVAQSPNTAVLHLGIGGAQWGLRLLMQALPSLPQSPTVYFVSSLDTQALAQAFAQLRGRQVLVLVHSRSFQTQETLHNLGQTLAFLQSQGIAHPWAQVWVMTAYPQRAQQWGVPSDRIVPLDPQGVGRFSLWESAPYLLGMTHGAATWAALCAGARAMDNHFREAPLLDNAPVQMALASLANAAVLGLPIQAMAVYDQRLAGLLPHLQQLHMESLGKQQTASGRLLQVPAAPALLGMIGTDDQHACFQWLHQGAPGAPVDFIMTEHCADVQWQSQHEQLWAHALAHKETLAQGYRSPLPANADPVQRAQWQQQQLPGSRAANMVVLPQVDPYSVGALLALYEHQIFVQSVLWGVNPFEQWGVEWGKSLLATFMQPQHASEQTMSASAQYWRHQMAERQS